VSAEDWAEAAARFLCGQDWRRPLANALETVGNLVIGPGRHGR
jgi:hypothetical protein